MMAAGGEQKRQELFSKVSSHKMSASFDQMNLGGSAQYNEEEAKVAQYGDIGQGERLTGAKAAAQRKRKN